MLAHADRFAAEGNTVDALGRALHCLRELENVGSNPQARGLLERAREDAKRYEKAHQDWQGTVQNRSNAFEQREKEVYQEGLPERTVGTS